MSDYCGKDEKERTKFALDTVHTTTSFGYVESRLEKALSGFKPV